jgi:hypothetical protein
MISARVAPPNSLILVEHNERRDHRRSFGVAFMETAICVPAWAMRLISL